MRYTYRYNYQFRWYHLIFPILVLVIGVPLFVFFILNSSGIISSTPDWALDRFCTDLQHGDMQNAYDLFSSDYQNSHTQAEFVQTWSNKNPAPCVHSVSASSDGKASGTLTIRDFFSGVISVYHVTLIQNNIIDWKLSSIDP